ncbi:hypothetical protein ZWY2020_015451 [Hordeum vulgare]|nr:hypothetical protein ZWY2020_015451 [Hordeum vulgare]
MEDLTQRLPHDLLADVLRRLQTTSPCSLAASRCVCKTWCGVVDANRLIADLLPHWLTGIFVHLDGETLPTHLSLDVSSTNMVPFDYLKTPDDKPLDGKCLKIKQHCNGLLLLTDVEWEEEWWVLNPATRQWAHLPPSPPMCTPGMEDNAYAQSCDTFYHENYLVFDPSVSLHYEDKLEK